MAPKFSLSNQLPAVFARAQMHLSVTSLNGSCLLGMPILLGLGPMFFSHTDRAVWVFVVTHMILVQLYVDFKSIGPDVSQKEPQDAPESP